MTYLTDKTILVTGASRGIGAAVARVCQAAGGHVIAHASGMSDAAASVSGELGTRAQLLRQFREMHQLRG